MSKNNGFGTRGIPDVLGGVETHCQNLYPAIKQQFDADICVIARSPYVNYKRSVYKKSKPTRCGHPKALAGSYCPFRFSGV